ncbi:putative alpha-1,2-galactosyltransferase gmh1 [Neolecta irregularis DAH-3]|uniref:Putative alpha-1,2-galactosyltransferase gmh1 n=1 Tax=Neolecta irregularis (strain DAH-3) TaxID=1198029 RepID=A0A1U7LPE8_NEOID|nr:putative alpha-1,2-galactosyltransferase gmh1 [Neolecta irregularis DAH-3]|eukprot:OLL24524.1 putative alpha-1,2-galactosyltransferase gmh1 [Neolecta irregularis DAH-3]
MQGRITTSSPLQFEDSSDAFQYLEKPNFKNEMQSDSNQSSPNNKHELEKVGSSIPTETQTILQGEPLSDLIISRSEGEKVVLVLASNGEGNQGDIEGLLEKVIKDRTSYAKRHGYGFFYTNTNRYNAGDMHPTWLKSKAISEAMTTFPNAAWFWWLDQDAIIMTPNLSIEAELLNPKILSQKLLSHEKYIRKGLPDSFSPDVYDLDKVDLICSQDHNGINAGSILIRRSSWTDIVLDLWNNPDLKQATGFGKEQDLIRDLLVRHDTFRNHAGIVQQRLINAYYEGGDNMKWQEGDLVVHFAGCWVNKKCGVWWNEMWEISHPVGSND